MHAKSRIARARDSLHLFSFDKFSLWKGLGSFGIVWEALGLSGEALERFRESLGDLEKGMPAARSPNYIH